MNAKSSKSPLPSGTVTLLFTDIEGSTELLKRLPEQYGDLLAAQRSILREIFERREGTEVDTQGDSFFISFPRATQAVTAAVEVQRVLAEHEWPGGEPLRVRMGLHTGEPCAGDESYVGLDVHRAARIGAVGHGGQVLLSETTAALVQDDLPEGVNLIDLGHHLLKDMERPEQIHQVAIDGLQIDFPPIRSQDQVFLPPNNLPFQLTPFVGRVDELDALEALLHNPHVRLITVLAAGGMGKTRLALAVAERQLNPLKNSNGTAKTVYHDGVFFVPLAGFETKEAIVPSVAETIGFRLSEKRDPLNQLVNHLSQKAMLLIMDNYEHLLDGVGLISKILEGASQVKILTTSRVPLKLAGENRFQISGLHVPQNGSSTPEELAEFDAVELLIQCARRTQPGFTLAQNNQKDIVRVCELLEGLPLGIRLAAAWVGMLSLSEIVEEIEEGLDLLETDEADSPDRQRSMRAVFDYSWNLLRDVERGVMGRLTVFRGGISRGAAKTVAGASLRDLRALVDKSLLTPDEGGRYEMHGLLQQYVDGKLTASPEEKERAQARHCEFFSRFLEIKDLELRSDRQLEALAGLEAEIGNAAAAWSWAIDNVKVDSLNQAIDGLCRFYLWRRRLQQGRMCCQNAIEAVASFTDSAPPSEPADIFLAKASAWLSYFVAQKDAVPQLSDTLKTLEEKGASNNSEYAFVLRRLGDLALKSDLAAAKANYERSLDIYRSLGDRWGQATVLTSLGWVAASEGDLEGVRQLGEESRRLWVAIGDRRGLADILWLLGTQETFLDFEKADRLISKSLELRHEIGERIVDMEAGPIDLGMTLTWIGKMREAEEVRDEVLAFCLEEGTPDKVAAAYLHSGTSKLHVGKCQDAEEFVSTAYDLYQESGDQRGIACSLWRLALAEMSNGNLEEAIIHCRGSIKYFRTIGDSAEIAWAFGVLAILLALQEDYRGAIIQIREALKTTSGLLKNVTLCHCFSACNIIFVGLKQMGRARETFQLISRFPIVRDSAQFDSFREILGEARGSDRIQRVPDSGEVKQEQDLVIIVEGILDELEEMVSQAETSASDRGRGRWGRTSKTNEWIRLVKENDN